MYIVLLLALLQTPEPRKLTIYVNENRESKILISELNRDWLSRGVCHKTLELHSKQFTISSRMQLVKCREYEAPYWQYGKYSKKHKFDYRTFEGSGRAMGTVYVLVENTFMDLGPWKTKVEDIHNSAKLKHCDAILRWMEDAYPDDFMVWQYVGREFGERQDAKFVKLTEAWGRHKDCPKYKPPTKFPPSPLLQFPWE